MDDWRELKLIMKALGDVARLTIVYHLARHEEVTVTALTEMLALSQPLVSWHLRKLRKAGLIHTHRVGRQVYCSLNVQRVRHGIQGLEGLIDPTLLLSMPPSGAALIEAEDEIEVEAAD